VMREGGRGRRNRKGMWEEAIRFVLGDCEL
jgi:hypothetical protein